MTHANLSEANLREATLRETNFRSADLSGANLSKTILQETKFVDTNLSSANLNGSIISEAKFDSADLREATFEDAYIYRAIFASIDLSMTRKLEMVNHRGPSTIDDATKYRSHGNIPEPFLRGIGMPDDQISYMRHLFEEYADYYSCFISYSSKNQDIAEKLCADLQRNGVCCWYAPEDMKPGDPIYNNIDDAVRRHEKLLLILSKDSIESAWVEEEKDIALKKEVQDQQLVLFPIRIDNAVETTDEEWAARIQKERHIGDFTSWQQPDAYQHALEQLLRNLKMER